MPQSPEQRAAYAAKLDRFAELLSQEVTIPQIRERMGMGNGSAQRLMCQLRASLGWQAQ